MADLSSALFFELQRAHRQADHPGGTKYVFTPKQICVAVLFRRCQSPRDALLH